jgi:hypothetical protein
MNTRRDFLLLVTLSAMVATGALAQEGASALKAASSSAQGAGSTPDFSGVWAKPYVGIESPRSGPGPVTNRSRRNGARNIYQYVGDYTNPILKPAAAEIVKKHGEMSLTGVPYPSPRNQCWPQGVPGIFPDTEIQIVQQPNEVMIFYSEDHEIRHIYMNQPHPLPVTPSWYGHSVGHYEGGTLVIDTLGVRIGPYAMVDFYGTPFTPALHVVERYRLIDYEAAKEAHEWGAKENGLARGAVDFDYKGKGLQLQFTVEDEGVFTMPWSATVTYRRAVGEWPEIVCAENLHSTYVTKDSAVPRADTPDF